MCLPAQLGVGDLEVLLNRLVGVVLIEFRGRHGCSVAAWKEAIQKNKISLCSLLAERTT